MKKILSLLILSQSLMMQAQSFVPNPPELDLKSYILIEPNTNTVIAEFNSDAQIEPASMTKVMTSYVIADQISNDLIRLEDEVLISNKAWRMEGSRMFIEAGKRVPVSKLLKGIIIQSGNDASVAMAEYAGGTEDGFVDLMNAYAGSLGLRNSLFQNSTGLPDANHFTSTSDLAKLTASFIKNFPEHYAIYKEKQYTYNDIKQLNRNRLLWKDDSSDGVKTGHTESAGYCLIGSAKRGDMRLITVVAGSPSDNARFDSSQRLLEYGFRFFATQKQLSKDQALKDIRVWGGQSESVQIGSAEDVYITLPRMAFKNLTVNYNYKNNLKAPIQKGQVIGSIDIISEDKVVTTSELVALADVEAKGFFGRLWSSIWLWVLNLFGLAGD
ncbi:D-alanyl-D-alanine carboxypeptidase [Gammaproteobacteria bacterium]|jgi:D-alanyl-D-alanine carboxypeptidase (penicillin-binding protein 5/6)|nr:D-alanyl-D-alanine carboxypeptidase [Gammaproteobacteria bacterium]MDB4252690.1 D-alanyl-D-alanine carboxypeptidase [Gammaproteobacteria bacterium]MDC1190965.1 D-alanyl-D-alanine carboxypeptidase [Gammaproteobacteria bacterium]|tara:strand:- start:6263 stop:7414 length:1152 start_codon:yes stop_codon:yes gene_type:complete